MKNNVEKLTLESFPDKIDVPTVIFFSREGCHFCKKLKPIYRKISLMERFQGIYKFYIVDADEEFLLYEKFKSDGVPAIYVLYEEDGIEIPYPSSPPPSGYGEQHITSFLDELMENNEEG